MAEASSYLSGSPADLEQMVRSQFKVKEFFALPEGELEFQLEHDEGTKGKFVRLESELAPRGYRPELSGTKSECVLTLRKANVAPPKASRVPVVLALFSMASLVVLAIIQELQYEREVPSLPGYFVFLSFFVCIAGLVGAHEFAQRVVARRRKSGHAGSYLIPGVPLIQPFLPALGFVSSQRSPALNKDGLFDTVVAGPLAMLAVAVALSLVGDLTSIQSTLLYQWVNTPGSTFVYNPSAVETWLATALGPYLPHAASGTLLASPIADAASVGFILVFVGLLPMVFFDGGYLVTLAWGEKAARVATYLSAALLLLVDLDSAIYWPIAVVVVLLAGRPMKLKLLDGVSSLSPSRQWFFIGVLILAFLCLPVPHTLATIKLG